MTTNALKPVERLRLHETIAQRLEELILSGDFLPGESLPTEATLASQLQVSRTVVRDAIRVLATKGLVEIRHGVGTFVTRSGRDRLAEAMTLSLRRGDYTPWELFIVRRGLEMVVVEEAIAKATPAQIAEMRAELVRYAAILRKVPNDPAVTDEEHTHFHHIMVQASGNRILMDILEPITVFRIPYYLGTAGMQFPDNEYFLARHEALINAIEQRDVAAARQAMALHLKELGERAWRATQEMPTTSHAFSGSPD